MSYELGSMPDYQSSKGASLIPITIPKHDEVHVWYCSVAAAPIDELYGLMDSRERSRAEAFAFRKDQNQFIAARGTLRQLLGAYRGQDPTSIVFDYGEQGKPSLKNDFSDVESMQNADATDLRFNVSHSFDAVLLAFTVGQDIGVDVEYVDNRVDILDLTRSVFSREEQKLLDACVPDGRLQRFFQLWTAKEAYIKMLGGGLSISLQDFTVQLQPGEASPSRVHTKEDGLLQCSIEHFAFPRGYMAAVAAQTSGWRMTMFDVEKRRAQ